MAKQLYPPQFMFNSGGTFIIIFAFVFDSNMCLKAYVNKYAKFWENTLTGF